MDKRSPLITIIVPCYKVEEYLPKCVESILSQTFQNLEIFLVDDGSPDKCGDICDNYAKKDRRIRVIHKKNGGLSDARNVAIDVATGEYIVFVDSDDYVAPEYIATLYGLILKYNSKIAICLPQPFYEGTHPVVTNSSTEEFCWESTKAIEIMFYQEHFDTSAWCKIYHRSLFDSGIRYPKGLLFEDLPTTYLLMENAYKVAFTKQKLYYYQLRKTSIEGSDFTPAKMDSAMKIFESMEAHPDIISKVSKAFRCRMTSFAFHILLKMPDNYAKREMLYSKIREYRTSVLFNGKARKKARLACALSYFGISNLKRIFKLIDKRK